MLICEFYDIRLFCSSQDLEQEKKIGFGVKVEAKNNWQPPQPSAGGQQVPGKPIAPCDFKPFQILNKSQNLNSSQFKGG